MKIHDVRFSNEECKLDTCKTLAPLSMLLSIFAMNSNIEVKSKVSSPCSIVKSVITAMFLGVLIFAALYVKVNVFFQHINMSIKLTDSVQMIYDYFQYIIDLYFINKYGRHISLEYFKQYESIDRILGINYLSMLRTRVVKLLIFFVSIWLISSICDVIAWLLNYDWIGPLVYSVSYVYLFIKILTTLDLTSHVMHVGIRLRIIGDLVQEYNSGLEPLPRIADDIISNEKWLYSKANSRVLELKIRPPPLKTLIQNDYSEIKWLRSCYLLLTEQVVFINKMFGLRVVLNTLSLLIDMVRFTNLAVRIAIGLQQTQYKAVYFPTVSTVMRLLTCILVVVSVVRHCEQVYRQKDRIVRLIDHLVINKVACDELRNNMVELRTLIETRPINFNMANFFQLNNSLLISIASVVVTYTIIILQSIN